jgi:hypothetical protein
MPGVGEVMAASTERLLSLSNASMPIVIVARACPSSCLPPPSSSASAASYCRVGSPLLRGVVDVDVPEVQCAQRRFRNNNAGGDQVCKKVQATNGPT